MFDPAFDKVENMTRGIMGVDEDLALRVITAWVLAEEIFDFLCDSWVHSLTIRLMDG